MQYFFVPMSISPKRHLEKKKKIMPGISDDFWLNVSRFLLSPFPDRREERLVRWKSSAIVSFGQGNGEREIWELKDVVGRLGNTERRFTPEVRCRELVDRLQSTRGES